jgi:hypothetical protein
MSNPASPTVAVVNRAQAKRLTQRAEVRLSRYGRAWNLGTLARVSPIGGTMSEPQ